MRTRARFNRSGRGRRGAFTLMELMVVMTIMAALVALSASAVMKFMAVQQTTNTKSTLDRVQSQLIRAWSKAKDQALKEPIPPATALQIQTLLGGADANAAGRVRVLYVKLKMRQQFPMNFAEALNIPHTNPMLAAMGLNPNVIQSPVPALPGYVSYLGSHNVTVLSASVSPSAASESAVCLLMALQRGVSGAGIDPSELTAGGAAGDYFGMPYLTDAWGRPIFFARAPAGSLYLNPAFPVGLTGANDPGDPEGYLQSQGWVQTYGPLFTQLTLQVTAPPSQSYKLAPMIASGGPSDWSLKGIVQTPAAAFNPITFAPVVGSDAVFSTP